MGDPLNDHFEISDDDMIGFAIRDGGEFRVGFSYERDGMPAIERIAFLAAADEAWGVLVFWTDGGRQFYPGREVRRLDYAAPAKRR